MYILNLFGSKPLVIFLLMISIVLLWFGLSLPMMSIEISTTIPVIGEIELFQQTQSIWSGIVELFHRGYFLVASLIFLFSVMVPVIKLVCVFMILFIKTEQLRQRLHSFVLIIGKWSMADVFVVSIFIAFLASEAKTGIEAQIHAGFYWFTAYCLVSIACGQLLNINLEKRYT